MKKFYLSVFIILVLGIITFFYTRSPRNIISRPSEDPITPPISSTPTTTPQTEQTTTTTINLTNGKNFSLTHPDSYTITVAAQGFRRLRFMAKSPDNRLFAGEMYNASDTNLGNVYALDIDPTTKQVTSTHLYLSNLRNPHSVAFHTDPQKRTWLYIAETDKLTRYLYSGNDNKPSSDGEIIAHFPTKGQTPAQGGSHITRSLAFNNDKLYVSVGSSCNSCEESDAARAIILEMNPDGTNSTTYAYGLRNAVGITFRDGELFATNHGVDHLGNNKPDDTFYHIQKGSNYGWPYCYAHQNAVLPDTSKKWQQTFNCSTVPKALYDIPAHSAPLGLTVFKDRFIAALHGSGNKNIGTGYKLISIYNNSATNFLTGFLSNGQVNGRPAGVLTWDQDTMYITDDYNGALYVMQSK